MYSINLFTSRSRTQPNLFLLHRSPLVSSSAVRLVMPRAFARVLARSQHQIFRQISIVDIHQNPPRSFKICSHSSEVSGIEPARKHLIILFKLFPKRLQNRLHQYWIVHIQQRGLPQNSLPNFLRTFFKVALQGCF